MNAKKEVLKKAKKAKPFFSVMQDHGSIQVNGGLLHASVTVNGMRGDNVESVLNTIDVDLCEDEDGPFLSIRGGHSLELEPHASNVVRVRLRVR